MNDDSITPKRLLAVMIVAGLAATAFLAGCGGKSGGGSSTGGGVSGLPSASSKVTKEEVDARAKEIEDSIKRSSKGKELPEGLKKNIAEQAKRMLEQERAILKLAEKEGVKVSDKEVDNRIAGIKKSMDKTPGAFQGMLKAENKTEADFRRSIAFQMVYEQLRSKLEKGSRVSDAQAKAFYEANKRAFMQNGKPRPFAEVKELARRMSAADQVQKRIQAAIEPAMGGGASR